MGRLRDRSLLLSVRNAYEALAVSAEAVVDAVRGRLTQAECDERLNRFGHHVVRNAQIEISVKGGVPAGQTFVVMSNHQSHYDVPCLYYALGGKLRMVAKTELFSIPLFGQALRASGMIEIDRKNHTRAIASLAKAKEQIAAGTHIWIAPEGTRSETGDLGKFKKGGFVLAFDTDAPILPVSIQGTRDILLPHSARTARGVHVSMVIHEPIDIRPFKAQGRAGREALITEVRNAIASGL